MSDESDRRIGLAEVTAVTWVDDDGIEYKRVLEDGEVRDVPVGVR